MKIWLWITLLGIDIILFEAEIKQYCMTYSMDPILRELYSMSYVPVIWAGLKNWWTDYQSPE